MLPRTALRDETVTDEAPKIAFVRVLGPIQAVTTSGHTVDLARASQRRLVAVLAAEAPRSIRAEWIQELLAVSPSALRTIVSRDRRALGADAISGPRVALQPCAPGGRGALCAHPVRGRHERRPRGSLRAALAL